MGTASDVLRVARAELGYTETPANSNQNQIRRLVRPQWPALVHDVFAVDFPPSRSIRPAADEDGLLWRNDACGTICGPMGHR